MPRALTTDPIETTVHRLRAELGGARVSMLTEVRDGLEDAAEAYANAGLTEPDARRRAATEFGDPRAAAAQYRATELGRRGQRTAMLLGVGPVLVLLSWLLLGVAQGGVLVDGLDTGFGLITLAAVGTAGLGWWWTRQALRRGEPVARPARVVAGAVVALCLVTWTFSYAVEPWTSPADVRATGWQPVHAVEAFSMVTTAAMLVTALHCLAGIRLGVRARPGSPPRS